jgi:Ca2+-binding RTX toxin-like protein
MNGGSGSDTLTGVIGNDIITGGDPSHLPPKGR